MWNWFNCYLSGRHEYGPWCESGAMFLRCMHCGRRSPGWSIESKATPPITQPRAKTIATPRPRAANVVPFQNRAAS
jgi:hypothetical protein